MKRFNCKQIYRTIEYNFGIKFRKIKKSYMIERWGVRDKNGSFNIIITPTLINISLSFYCWIHNRQELLPSSYRSTKELITDMVDRILKVAPDVMQRFYKKKKIAQHRDAQIDSILAD
jgi:hypothetical protein